jgi:hypothetical protein
MAATLSIAPGRVQLQGVGMMSWHDAQRLATELQRAAHDARFLADLHDEASDPSRVCTVCKSSLREGIATADDPDKPGRLRHVVGSPDCSRALV